MAEPLGVGDALGDGVAGACAAARERPNQIPAVAAVSVAAVSVPATPNITERRVTDLASVMGQR